MNKVFELEITISCANCIHLRHIRDSLKCDQTGKCFKVTARNPLCEQWKPFVTYLKSKLDSARFLKR